jgi:TonB family protein
MRPHGVVAVGLVMLAICRFGVTNSQSLIGSYARTQQLSPSLPHGNEIPKATKPCSPEVAQWWRELREAGRAAAEATVRREETIKSAIVGRWSRSENVPDDEREILSADELSKLNQAVSVSKEKYLSLLSQAREKSYALPIDDGPVALLHLNEPRYTHEARMLKISGTIKTRVLFQADGTVARVLFREGLGHGLDESALQTIYDLVFLPARRESTFVAYWQAVDVDFRLR